MKNGKSKKKSPAELCDEANEKFGMDIESEANPMCRENYDDDDDLESDGNFQSSPLRGEEGGRDCNVCKRNFWTQVLRTVTKIASIVLAAFGLSSFVEED